MEQRPYLSKIVGLIRLIGITLIVVLVVMKIFSTNNSSQMGSSNFGFLIAILCVLTIIYYHIKKGINEIRAIQGFEDKRIQNFSIVYAVIILVLIIGNLAISESNLELNRNTLSLGLMASFITILSLVDIIEIWKRTRR